MLHIYFRLNRTEAWWSSLHAWNTNRAEPRSERKATEIRWTVTVLSKSHVKGGTRFSDRKDCQKKRILRKVFKIAQSPVADIFHNFYQIVRR